MKKSRVALLCSAICLLSATPTFAGQWYKEDGKWAYLDDSGDQIKEGWFTDNDGQRYNFTGGVVRSGINDIGGKKYYFNPGAGSLASGFITDGNNNKYFADRGGVIKTGWFTVNGQWFYAETTGKLVCGQLKDIGGDKYYFQDDGHMAVSEWVKDGQYYASGTGVIATKQWVDGTYVSSSGKATDAESKDSTGKKKLANKVYTSAEYLDLATDSMDRYSEYVEQLGNNIREWREEYNEKNVYNYEGEDDNYIDSKELKGFEEDTELNRAAALRAVELASCQRASGSRPDGTAKETIYSQLGIESNLYQETVAFGFDDGDDCYSELKGNSNHTNIWKNVNYTRMGIGVACDKDGRLYFVVLYAE